MYSTTIKVILSAFFLFLIGCQSAKLSNHPTVLNEKHYTKIKDEKFIGRINNAKGRLTADGITEISKDGVNGSMKTRLEASIEYTYKINTISYKIRITHFDYDLDNFSDSESIYDFQNKILGKDILLSATVEDGYISNINFKAEFDLNNEDKQLLEFMSANVFGHKETQIKQGDTIHSWSVGPFKLISIAVGEMNYKNRDVIVGKYHFVDSPKNINSDVFGYEYLDILTSLPIYQSYTLSMYKGDFKFTQTNRSELILEDSSHPLNKDSLNKLDDVEAKCVELGFTKGTEKFGNCVMTLFAR